MNKKLLSVMLACLLALGVVFSGCGNPASGGGSPNDTSGGGKDRGDTSYITVYDNPETKSIIDIFQGTPVTVARVASGRYNDYWWGINELDDFEGYNLNLREYVYDLDDMYGKITSFLNLYGLENSSNSKIQVYYYPVVVGGAAMAGGEMVLLPAAVASTYAHELTHIIDSDNRRQYQETWHSELLAMMAQVFYGDTYMSQIWQETYKHHSPYIPLFGKWGELSYADNYYALYGSLAAFLFDKYGQSIFYDLMHDQDVNTKALENVLAKRGTTLSAMVAEFESLKGQ